MKCASCNSSLVFVDSETDVAWCKTCGYKESIDYMELKE